MAFGNIVKDVERAAAPKKRIKRPVKVSVPYAPTPRGKAAERRNESSSARTSKSSDSAELLSIPSLPKAIAKKQRDLKQETRKKVLKLKALNNLEHQALKTLRGTFGSSRSATPSVPTASALKTPQSGKVDLLATAVEHQVVQPAIKAAVLPKSKTFGQKAYQRVAEWGPTVILGAPEVAAGAKAAQAAIKGVELGEAKLGGTAVTKAVKATTPSEQVAVSTRTAEEAAKGGVKRVIRRATGRAGKADRATIRQVTGTSTRKEFAAQVGFPLKAAKASGAQTLPVVRGHEKAIVEEPGKVAKTTLRATPGLVTAPVGIAAHVGVSAGRAGSEALHEAGVPGFRGYSGTQILDPLKYEGKAQIDFAKEVAKVLTSDDPAYVQKEVEDNLGLLIPITAGLGVKAITDRAGAERIVGGVRKLVNKARRHPYSDVHGPPRVFEKAGQHKIEAREAARARTTIRAEQGDRSHGVAKEGVRAEGKTRLRALPKTKRYSRQKYLEVHTGDAVPFLARNGIDLSKPEAALAEIKRIRNRLGKAKRALPEGELHTREVLDHLIAEPKRLKDPHLIAAVDDARAQELYARETPGLSPDHSEAARYSSVAVHNDIPHASERFPDRIKPFMRTGEKAGVDARKQVLKEAHSDARGAKGFLRKAATIDKHSNAMRRELAFRERQNREQLGIAALPPAHEALRARIDRLDLQAAHLKERARHAEELATHKREVAGDMRNDPGTWKELEQAMVGDVKAHIDKTPGLTEPEYAYTGFSHGLPTQGTGNYARIPGKSKRKTGRAEAEGAVREGLRPYIQESIAKPAARRHVFAALRSFLDRNQARVNGQTVFDGDHARRIFEDPNSGIDPRHYVAVPTQMTNRAFDFVKKDAGILDANEKWVAEMRTLVSEHEQSLAGLSKGAKYHLVRRPAADEFFSQMTSARMTRIGSQINRGTSYLILATSPAWAVAQVAAEFAQASIAEPRILNPANLARYIDAYKKMEPHKRWAFDGWTGVTTRNVEHAADVELSLKPPGDMADAATAYGVLNRTPLGRLIRSIPQTIRNIDQWKGGRIRVLTAVAKIDRDMNGRLNGFLHGTGNLYREQARISNDLKGMPLAKQLDYWAEHPKVAERYGQYIDDMLGNWTALTKNERVASQLAIFYPFVRMSLRWTFHSFPKHHPIRAAASYWLGQQNANELKKLLHGDPAFFTQWGQVPLHLGPNETELLPLERLAPGSNAIIEALGGGSNIETGPPLGVVASRIAQPAISTAATALYGINPLTGKQEAHSGTQALNAGLSLSPIAREAEKLVVPGGRKRAEGSVELFGSTERQNALDKLFAKLKGSETAQAIRGLVLPALPKDASHEADIAKLGRILGNLSKNSSSKRKGLAADLAQGTTPKGKAEAQVAKMKTAYEKANGELDKMFQKYKVPYKKEEKRFFSRYGDIYYGNKESAADELNKELGIPPQPSKSELDEQLGIPPTPSAEELDKQLGIR